MKTSTVSIAFLLIALCVQNASALPLQPRATTAQCRAAWAQASASNSCDSPHIEGGGQCYIKVNCNRSQSGKQANMKWVSLPDVPRLVNCDGRLAFGSC